MNVSINNLMQLAVDEGASDIHIAVGAPPVMRINGHLHPLEAPSTTRAEAETAMQAITPVDHLERIEQLGGTDFGYSYEDKARFRVSIFKQKANFGIVLRQIPTQLLELDTIGLSHHVKELLLRPRGLILVTGPTGCGKSTTLASMLDVINRERSAHIITIEDPIEYYHDHKRSIVTQREVGVDVSTFSEAVRRALRQDPDVILVGEMRDLETMAAAITAAETGHLVFATLHTTGAARTVDRIVDAFPNEQQEQIRAQLSSSLLAVISQELLPRRDQPGRVAAFEVMIATQSIQNLIRDRKTFQINSAIQTGGKVGMISLDAHLCELCQSGMISKEDVLTKAQDTEFVRRKLNI
ncbi:MAG: type IV pilus twitching motility protein PilT [Kiritimatiellales bacterium]|nr:type IV pilus twitching motility protein PilT [Kiritimatiellales bacterium]